MVWSAVVSLLTFVALFLAFVFLHSLFSILFSPLFPALHVCGGLWFGVLLLACFLFVALLLTVVGYCEFDFLLLFSSLYPALLV